jgi:hypothetical protein
MRTFHSGGVATKVSEEKTITFKYPVIINSITGVHVEMEDGSWLFTRKGSMMVTRIIEEFEISSSDKLLVSDGDKVSKGAPLFERNGKVVNASDISAVVIRDGKLLLTGRELKEEIKNGSSVIVKAGDIVAKDTIISKEYIEQTHVFVTGVRSNYKLVCLKSDNYDKISASLNLLVINDFDIHSLNKFASLIIKAICISRKFEERLGEIL